MERIILMVLRNIFLVPYAYIKMKWYAAHMDKISDDKIYQLINYINVRASGRGNVEREIIGIENLPAKDGFIVYANHQGLYDPLPILEALYPRKLSIVAKKELGKIPFIKDVFTCTKSYLIDRDDVKQGMKVIINVANDVKAGRNFLIFPQGTRSKEGNMPGEYKGGSFKAATKAKCPIVPLVLIDTYKVFDRKNIKKQKVQLRFLKPLMYEEYKDMKTTEIAEEVRRRTIEVVEALNTEENY